MRFSIWPSPQRPWHEALRLAQAADALGYHSVFVADHFMPNDPKGATPLDGPMMEAWSVLAGMAAATTRVRLGTLVCGNTYRHPAVLAKIATTTDQVSGGRVVLGLGAGWQVNEHAAYGIDLFDMKTRIDRFEEACEVVTSLVRQPRTTFAGRHYTITDAPCDPKPAGPLPLLVGAAGEQRTMRVAARFADEWNCWADPAVFAHKRAVLDRHCESLGRDPSTIAGSTQGLFCCSTDESVLGQFRDRDLGQPKIVGTPNEVAEIAGRYRDAGVDELILPDFLLGPVERAVATYELFMAEVASQVA